ncbi:hypothetical protein, partial [Streptomyces lonegramiae]
MNRWQRTWRSGILATALVLASIWAGPVAGADGADGADDPADGPRVGLHLEVKVRIPGVDLIWPGWWCPTPTPTPTKT